MILQRDRKLKARRSARFADVPVSIEDRPTADH
jgi:hypothetical protein